MCQYFIVITCEKHLINTIRAPNCEIIQGESFSRTLRSQPMNRRALIRRDFINALLHAMFTKLHTHYCIAYACKLFKSKNLYAENGIKGEDARESQMQTPDSVSDNFRRNKQCVARIICVYCG